MRVKYATREEAKEGNRKRARERAKAKHIERKAGGLCLDCGEPSDLARCPDCRLIRKLRSAGIANDGLLGREGIQEAS